MNTPITAATTRIPTMTEATTAIYVALLSSVLFVVGVSLIVGAEEETGSTFKQSQHNS